MSTDEKTPEAPAVAAPHDYRLRYTLKFEAGHFTAAELEAARAGGADAIVLGSLLFPDNGSYSLHWRTIDGRTGGDLAADELWKAWAVLAFDLAHREDLNPAKRALCQAVHAAVMGAIAVPERDLADPCVHPNVKTDERGTCVGCGEPTVAPTTEGPTEF